MTVVVGGLMALLNDPEYWARIAERKKVIEHLVQQTGCTPEEARWAIDDFEHDISHEGVAKN